MRDGQQTTTSEDRATQLLICEALSLAIPEYQEQQPHHLGLAVGNGDLAALLPGDALAVWSALGLARCRALNLLQRVKTNQVSQSLPRK